MSTIEKHEPGMFCWLDLATTDVEAAKSFYGGLFGWTAPDQSMDEVRNYGMFKLDGRDVGGLSDLQDAQRQLGVPPHWTLFIAVENADASAAKAKQLGATISVQPFDVSDVGRVASIQDPQGAHFSIWQARNHPGIGVGRIPGTLCWCELATTDAAKATDFYTNLFGWKAKVSDVHQVQYTEWSNQGQPAGGMMQMSEEFGDAPSHWMPYFLVEDCAAAASKAASLGAKIEVGPREIGSMGHFALVRDPQGAYFSIFQGSM